MNKLLFLLSLFVFSVHAQKLKGTKPNIILVFTDDQGSNLSYMGHPIICTPNIDAFAKESIRLKDFHVSPSCSPARAALMSGRHEFKNGVTHTILEREYLDISVTTFPQLLQKGGYSTGIFGKWHLGDMEAYQPQNRGFDEVLIHGAGGIGQKHEESSNNDFPPNIERRKVCYFDPVLLHNNTIVQTKGYCADIFFDAALSWIKGNLDNNKPFFTYISTNTPHAPLISPQENLDRIKKRHPELKRVNGRYGMIENIDDNFGKMMKKLEEWNALENTIIIFTTDNGAPYKKGSSLWNNGYPTGKGTAREGGTHVPAFISWKGTLAPNRDFNGLTSLIDLYKTFSDLAGVKIPKDIQQIEGKSLIDVLKNTSVKWEDRMLFHHRGKWPTGKVDMAKDKGSVRTQRWRLVENKILYDIQNDPKETEDVAAKYPEVVVKLKKAYLKWWKETLPFMINEKKHFKGEAPYKTLYNKQLEEKGIPFWKPNN